MLLQENRNHRDHKLPRLQRATEDREHKESRLQRATEDREHKECSREETGEHKKEFLLDSLLCLKIELEVENG